MLLEISYSRVWERLEEQCSADGEDMRLQRRRRGEREENEDRGGGVGVMKKNGRKARGGEASIDVVLLE